MGMPTAMLIGMPIGMSLGMLMAMPVGMLTKPNLPQRCHWL